MKTMQDLSELRRRRIKENVRIKVGDRVEYLGDSHRVARTTDDQLWIVRLEGEGRPNQWVKRWEVERLPYGRI